jgi:hypothetical protein
MKLAMVVLCVTLTFMGVCLGPASAETSVYDILRMQQFTSVAGVPENWYWGDGGDTDGKGIQTWTGGTEAKLMLVKEDAGWAGVNSFGFYDVTNPTRKTEIFSGVEAPFTEKSYLGASLPYANWGFYMNTEGYTNDWYSQHKLNADGYAHERVARYTAGTVNWYALFWEDTTYPSTTTWYASDTGTRNWKTSHPIEPDHNDMAVRFRLEGGYGVGQTPELSSGALLLLGMLPVGLGWLKRRRT